MLVMASVPNEKLAARGACVAGRETPDNNIPCQSLVRWKHQESVSIQFAYVLIKLTF